jgi:hypothetical protein
MSRFLIGLYRDALSQKGAFFDGDVLYVMRAHDNESDRRRFARVTRQLTYYGFKLFPMKYDKSYIGYTHPNFVQGRPDLLKQIYRYKNGAEPRKRGRKKKLPIMYIVLPDDAHDGNEHPFLEQLYV